MAGGAANPALSVRSGAHRRPETVASRCRERRVAAACAVVAAASHLPLIGRHLHEAPYIGWSFAVLAVVSVAIALALLARDDRRIWVTIAVLYSAAVLVYLVSRTVGLPQISDDIGNWTEPASFPALASEGGAVIVSVRVLIDAGFGARRCRPRCS